MLPTICNSIRSFLTVIQIETQFIRYGHQTCTRNSCKHPKPKHRGIKRNHGEKVEAGEFLMTQKKFRLHPGMNVTNSYSNLIATQAGTVCITAEEFNPNFENTMVMKQYSHLEGQKIFKKYMHVIPDAQHNRFKLIDVV